MAQGPVDWGLAERVAVRVAGREPLAESYHYDRLAADFDEVTAQAEELVAQATGLRSASGAARARVVGRDDWVRANLASFRRMLRPVMDKMTERTDRTGPFASVGGAVSRRAAGVEVGLLLGWMAGRVLGQYDLLIIEDERPEDQDLVYYVGPNVLALEKRFGFPPQEFRLWLALHEVTHRAQFTGIPWLREHFLSLVHKTLDAVDPDPRRFVDAMTQVVDDLRSGRNPLDEGGLAAIFASPDQRNLLGRIGGMMSLLEGHGDVTMDRAGQGYVPSAPARSMVTSPWPSSRLISPPMCSISSRCDVLVNSAAMPPSSRGLRPLRTSSDARTTAPRIWVGSSSTTDTTPFTRPRKCSRIQGMPVNCIRWVTSWRASHSRNSRGGKAYFFSKARMLGPT